MRRIGRVGPVAAPPTPRRAARSRSATKGFEVAGLSEESGTRPKVMGAQLALIS